MYHSKKMYIKSDGLLVIFPFRFLSPSSQSIVRLLFPHLSSIQSIFNFKFSFLHQQVAARNCRRRKIDQIKQLEDDVTRIRYLFIPDNAYYEFYDYGNFKKNLFNKTKFSVNIFLWKPFQTTHNICSLLFSLRQLIIGVKWFKAAVLNLGYAYP